MTGPGRRQGLGQFGRIWLAVGCLVSALPGAAPAETFVDPLDAAASRTDLATSTWLLDVTHAGQRLVAAGIRGHIVYSDDEGATWTQAEVPVSVTLTAVSFPTPRQGWAVGHSGIILHSGDGGEHWDRQLDGRETPEQVYSFYDALAAQGDENAASLRDELEVNWEHGPEQPWLDTWFDNDRHGFVVGPFGLILGTSDGGQSWEPWMHRVDNPQALHLNSISAIAGALYIPSERGLIFRKRATDDGFLPLQTPYGGSFFGLCGNRTLLLAYGLRGTLYASLDNGESWSGVETGITTGLTACTPESSGKFLIAALSGQVIEVGLESGLVTSAKRAQAPWPLAGLSLTNSAYLGVGYGGVWLPNSPK